MCIIGDYRQIIAQREMGLTYSEIQVPRKKINRELQHNPGLRPLYSYMDTKVEIRKRLLKRKVLEIVS
ncbi:MAG TPA: hypothetical protein VLA53_06710 [Nitrosopumilaceae archaeon]|nr:hypothetical protein [Nitrosopumilaceae archaeon]